jgi:integrase/recombinase XerD
VVVTGLELSALSLAADLVSAVVEQKGSAMMEQGSGAGTAGAGGLAGYLVGFREELARCGYGTVRSGAHLELFADLCRWLEREGVALSELGSDRFGVFLADRRRRGQTDLVSRVGASVLLGYLTSAGVIPGQGFVVPEGPCRPLLERYRHYLETERGLTAGTVERYVGLAGRLAAALGRGGVVDWQRVRARDVTRFLLDSGPVTRGGHARDVVPALRSFLRFCYLEGVVRLPLDGAVPSAAGRRLSPLPQGISAGELDRLLGGCDREGARGRRDYAVLILLARLGLRAGEVAAMVLEDLDWRRGELVVHGKARRDEALPLPADVGEAIAGYLRSGRPQADSRSVFLRCCAPRRGLSAQGVTNVVYHACDRAGIARIGAHRLRHTAASQMLAAGASLGEVGEALRQRSVTSTAIYAKVDRARLAALARPWPGSAR